LSPLDREPNGDTNEEGQPESVLANRIDRTDLIPRSRCLQFRVQPRAESAAGGWVEPLMCQEVV
jgi:hypothetical protein